jgi:hypothetical protein
MALIGRLAAVLAVLVGTASALAAGETKESVSITRESYRGWPDTVRIGNGSIEARVVTAIGPRVIDLRSIGGENLFHVRDAEAGGHGEADWVFRGGWRLWIAPERRATTYVPDNTACQVEIIDSRTVRVTARRSRPPESRRSSSSSLPPTPRACTSARTSATSAASRSPTPPGACRSCGRAAAPSSRSTSARSTLSTRPAS